MDRVRVGIVGCGMISDIYFTNIGQKFPHVIEACACADTNFERASAKALAYGVRAMPVDELLGNKNIDLIVNLTVPAAHAEISKRALLSGKHVYSEKPLAADMEDAKELLRIAQQKGLVVGCAPDTFLGGGMQTVIKMLGNGMIGRPIFCNAMMLSGGPEAFHPHPEFLYRKGAGPLYDMGPYYVTAMAAMFGAVERVAGFTKHTYEKRTISGEERGGAQFPCEVDTHISGVLEFKNGVHANMTLSWDMNYPYYESKLPFIEIFGEQGEIIAPDPNMFGGLSSNPFAETGNTVRIRRGAGEFTEHPLEFGYTDNARGIGLADMARAIRTGKRPRASGELALHVLEVLAGIEEAGAAGRYVEIESDCTRPEPFGGLEF